MIRNDVELQVMQERIQHFQRQIAHLRHSEEPEAFRLAASGFQAEVDRMQLEVREYLARHPLDMTLAA